MPFLSLDLLRLLGRVGRATLASTVRRRPSRAFPAVLRCVGRCEHVNERGGESTVSTNRFFFSFVSFLFDKPSNPKIQKPKKKSKRNGLFYSVNTFYNNTNSLVDFFLFVSSTYSYCPSKRGYQEYRSSALCAFSPHSISTCFLSRRWR